MNNGSSKTAYATVLDDLKQLEGSWPTVVTMQRTGSASPQGGKGKFAVRMPGSIRFEVSHRIDTIFRGDALILAPIILTSPSYDVPGSPSREAMLLG